MRLLTNENIPGSLLRLLRAHGHDVLSAKDSLRGQPDPAILARAQADGRILVTQDKDFGELAWRQRLPANCGVILFRFTGSDPDGEILRMQSVIESRSSWEGQFAVATEHRLRVRALPQSPPD